MKKVKINRYIRNHYEMVHNKKGNIKWRPKIKNGSLFRYCIRHLTDEFFSTKYYLLPFPYYNN